MKSKLKTFNTFFESYIKYNKHKITQNKMKRTHKIQPNKFKSVKNVLVFV